VPASELTSTATCTAFRAVCGSRPDAPGVQSPVSGRVLAERVGWLADLVQQMADEVIAGHWSDAGLTELAGGVGPDGRRLPGNGWMALRRLGWNAVSLAGVVASDRVRRIAEEEAARALRLAVHRRAIVAALIATWPTDPFARTDDEWSALRAVLPDGIDIASIRNRTRQIAAFVTGHGRLPADLCELERPPTVARQVSLAAADRQQVAVDRVDEATVRVWTQLPVCPAPGSYRDWAWHALDATVPLTVPAGVTGRTHKETQPVLQMPHTVSTTSPWQPHRVRGAILGRGFHRHVHATPAHHRDGGAGQMSALLRIA
jgi:hypothetical protein